MTYSRWMGGLVTALLLAEVACTPTSATTKGDAAAGNGGSTDPGATDDGGTAPGTDPGTNPSDAGSTADSANPAGVAIPVLTTLTANAAGRTGSDLLLTVAGTDDNKNATGLHVSAQDATGSPIQAFDTNWDGVPDSADGHVLFDQASAAGKATFTKTVTLPGVIAAFPGLKKVVAAIEDASGAHSTDVSASVIAQEVRSITQSCDPAQIVDRCVPGTYCGGATPVCTAADAPQITQFAYVPNATGPHMLLAGTDPGDGVGNVHLAFLDKSGVPVMVDLTGDKGNSSSFDLSIAGSSTLGTFFFDNQAGVGFDTAVAQVAATPSDGNSNVGKTVTAKLAAATLAASGKTCDPHGFIGCVAGYACAPGIVGAANTCITTASAKTAISTAAPTIEPAKGILTATGYAQGVSLFDPPSDCVATGVKGRPQGVVNLHLPNGATTLKITTATPQTNFDTVLYVLPGLGQKAGAPMGCNDDASGFASTLTLSSVAAGDYTIVVGSVPAAGGEFGVSVEVH